MYSFEELNDPERRRRNREYLDRQYRQVYDSHRQNTEYSRRHEELYSPGFGHNNCYGPMTNTIHDKFYRYGNYGTWS